MNRIETIRLNFRDLNLTNFSEYEKRLLKSEKVFAHSLREDSEGLVEMISSRGAIGRLAFAGRKYVGNTLGFSPTGEQITNHQLLYVEEDPKMIYFSNLVVIPSEHGRGYGRELMGEFLRASREREFRWVEGHFRAGKNGGSFYLITSFGAKKLEECENWAETGETYVHCRLKL